MNTIEAAREYNVGTYIMASSEIYQEPTTIPTNETERANSLDVQNPRFSYAGGKLIGELLSINSFRAKKQEMSYLGLITFLVQTWVWSM